MILLKNGLINLNDELVEKDILIDNDKIIKIDNNISNDNYTVYDVSNMLIMPGMTDCHVHLREPGYEYKETIKSGTMAAAKGGITTVMAMPNLNPYPDNYLNLKVSLDRIKSDSVVDTYPYGCITKSSSDKELANIKELKDYVKSITDDGKGVNNLDILEQACKLAKAYNLTVTSHAEDNVYKTAKQGEYLAVEREIEIAKKTKVNYHFCHLSCKESFDLIRTCHMEGYNNITCEVSPHHLFLNEDMINGNPNFKMNPPLRTKADMEETVKALLDGTATVVASDHAPHSKEEKSLPYSKALNGIIGLETMIPLVFTNLVKTGLAKISDMENWFINNPAKIFNLPVNKLEPDYIANITVLDIFNPSIYTTDEILSLSKNSPFIGKVLYGMPILTICHGKIVYERKD